MCVTAQIPGVHLPRWCQRLLRSAHPRQFRCQDRYWRRRPSGDGRHARLHARPCPWTDVHQLLAHLSTWGMIHNHKATIVSRYYHTITSLLDFSNRTLYASVAANFRSQSCNCSQSPNCKRIWTNNRPWRNQHINIRHLFNFDHGVSFLMWCHDVATTNTLISKLGCRPGLTYITICPEYETESTCVCLSTKTNLPKQRTSARSNWISQHIYIS